ncbi:EboA domain-containing protein [Aquipuribacter sp. MA13-6]|uniref:EboA domain-containing protein n=1 Tax=unclassified Aquipuribacter TaxID=2635084 RepID=UPI003EE854ED
MSPDRWTVASWSQGAPALADELEARLPEEARPRWRAAQQRVAEDPGCLDVVFPATGRTVGRAPLAEGDEQGLLGSVDDLARVLLLRTATDRADLPRHLYRDGDSAERRAVLRALHLLTAADDVTDLLEDALRTNDPRLVAAALGPAADALDAAGWRQAVLKCLFTGVPLACVHRLSGRADAELEGMVARYVAERVAAGRDVPADVGDVLPPTSPALAHAGLSDDLQGGHPDRLAAASRARALLLPRG